ncbi:hypothetical protein D3C72_1568970 [compost metagenome]
MGLFDHFRVQAAVAGEANIAVELLVRGGVVLVDADMGHDEGRARFQAAVDGLEGFQLGAVIRHEMQGQHTGRGVKARFRRVEDIAFDPVNGRGVAKVGAALSDHFSGRIDGAEPALRQGVDQGFQLKAAAAADHECVRGRGLHDQLGHDAVQTVEARNNFLGALGIGSGVFRVLEQRGHLVGHRLVLTPPVRRVPAPPDAWPPGVRGFRAASATRLLRRRA